MDNDPTNGAPSWYTRIFWAKAQPYGKPGPERVHLLEHHLADVGACFEALVSQATIRYRLARTAGRETLDETTAARLCVFAALHDVGKVNIGFQSRVWTRSDLDGEPYVHRVGHTADVVPVLLGTDWETSKWFFDALGWDDFCGWDDQGGAIVSDFLIATLSHHGSPLRLEGSREANPQAWRQLGELNPESHVRRIGTLLREWFPAAWNKTGPSLPDHPPFQHMFLGLCTLADWLGSNESWFPYESEPNSDYFNVASRRARHALKACGVDIGDQRQAVRDAGPLPGFPELFGFESANAIQTRTAATTSLNERLAVVESETGSGKTEAALWRFARLYEENLVDGIYFALPTRAAAVQIHSRIEKFAFAAFPTGHAPPVFLTVPGYLKDGDASGRILQRYEVWWDDHPDDTTRGRRWAAEHSKRYLAAQIAVGTVDQAMMSVLKVNHSHMRAACLARNLLVVDKVHASDTYMGAILGSLLKAHLGAGGHALLMSATLGSAARRRWLGISNEGGMEDLSLSEAIDCPYPSVSTPTARGERMVATGANTQNKTVTVENVKLMDAFDDVASRALEAARNGARVLIIRNTVGYAIRTQEALEQAAAGENRELLFNCGGVPAPHHGRFAPSDRRRLDEIVERTLGKGSRRDGGMVVVGTQTLEQSLDIDADLLIADLCPMDVLLQRIGRLHRHSRSDRPDDYRKPTCVVLLPEMEDLSPLTKRGVNGLNQFVYPDLRIIEATRRMIRQRPEWSIPAMNRSLVEHATHPSVLDSVAAELGASWQEHAFQVEGAELAEGITARHVIVERDKRFCGDNSEVVFGSNETAIRTRLGDEGINIDLASPQASPFGGQQITRVVLPGRWLPDRWEDKPVVCTSENGGFVFSVEDRRFRYDRFGLHRHNT